MIILTQKTYLLILEMGANIFHNDNMRCIWMILQNEKKEAIFLILISAYVNSIKIRNDLENMYEFSTEINEQILYFWSRIWLD